MNVATLEREHVSSATRKQFSPDQPINAPLMPPREWFFEVPNWFNPDGPLIQAKLDGPEAGRVAALVAPWGECILDGKNGCWTAPPSQTGYEYPHVAATVCADGETVRTANIGGRVNHADITWPMRAAVDHYANTATRTMRGRYMDTEYGVVFLGALAPECTIADGINVIGSALSGDWRYVRSLAGFELAGSQLVNNPAFRPVQRNVAEFAVTASLGAAVGRWTVPTATVVHESDPWTVGEEVAARIASLTALIVPMTHVDDLQFDTEDLDDQEGAAPVMDLDDTETDIEDPDADGFDDDIFGQVFGCHHCAMAGCRRCGHTGYKPVPDREVGYDFGDYFDTDED